MHTAYQIPRLKSKKAARNDPNIAYRHRQKPLRSRDRTPSAAVLASDRTSRTVQVRLDLSKPVRSHI